MTKFFISYSRVDLAFVRDFYASLQQLRPGDSIWYDKAPHGLLGGDDWWEQIMQAVADCDIFIYILSNESVQSRYCQAEFEEARRLQKRIITVQARDRTKLEGKLKDIQYVEMKNGVEDTPAWLALGGAIQRQIELIKPNARVLWRPRTPKPTEEGVTPRPANASADIDTPTLEIPAVEQANVTVTGTQPSIAVPSRRSSWLPFAAVIAMLAIAGVLIWQSGIIGGSATDPTSTDVSGGITPTEPTETPIPPSSTVTLTIEEALAATRAADDLIFAQTQEALTYQQQLEAAGTATAEAPTREAEYQQTLIAGGTATRSAILALTPTPTPDATATLVALRPQTNADWTPIERDFDGVTMVLVPAGCFMMGTANLDSDERPVHEQCFEAPFWIDKYEVTQAQFAAFNGEKANPNGFIGEDRPVERITWFEARDFCEQRRGIRLPTEAEWEYAARGVDGLIYPWGNDFIGRNVVYAGNASVYSLNVGSRARGVSWVGAHDMSGNVWEWVSSAYVAYPYTLDTHEIDNTEIARVVRGGAWDYNDSGIFRSANRSSLRPIFELNNRGFRCARALDSR